MKNILRSQFLQHVGQTSPSPRLIEVERAEGVYFYAPDGKRYYDLVAGVTVNNVGHGNRTVIDAVKKQAEDYMHIMVYGEVVERPQVEYARKVASLLPEGLDSVYFVNSGSEAIEGALKLAKRSTGRPELISCHNSYHGSTHGALSMLGGEELKSAYRPLLPDTQLIEFNNFDNLKMITERTAAVLLEPVQSEGGVHLPKDGYLKALRERCDEVGAVLIFDEVQTAFGRAGAMFSLLEYGVTPDILCLAKAFGGGMPLGAFISSKKRMDLLTVNPALGHITTFGGHPVCCAAGLAALNYLIDNDLVSNGEAAGALYEELLKDHPAVVEIRRAGLLIAVELGCSDKLNIVVNQLLKNGVMSDWFLFCDTAFRISPPLTITEAEVRDSVEIIIKVLNEL